MLRQGLIPARAHAIAEYVAGAVLIAAPFVLSFDAGAATAIAVVAGVALLAVSASTDRPESLSRMIPIGIHVALDLALAAVLIAAPFLFGFSDEGRPTAFFIVVGVVHLLLTIGTRFLPAQR